MASARMLAGIDRLLWILIYVGLFALILGVAIQPVQPAAGWTLTVGGGVAVAAGIVLILVRSRLSPPADATRSPSQGKISS